MARLIRGDKLAPSVRDEVLRAFVHRNTIEHPYPPAGGDGKGTDAEYLRTHAFYVVKDGSRLAQNYDHCVPAGVFTAEEN